MENSVENVDKWAVSPVENRKLPRGKCEMPIKSTFLAGKRYCRLNFDGFQSGSREVSHRMARSMESRELPQSASPPLFR